MCAATNQRQSLQSDTAAVMAGVPATNFSLYHQIRFSVGDPAALLDLPASDGNRKRVLILRDIEMERARKRARVDEVTSPAAFEPEGGLAGDRETATAQAVVECLRRAGIKNVVADRTLPLLFADLIWQAGFTLCCDPQMAVADRRAKDEQELDWMQAAQHVTEDAMEMACRMIGTAVADRTGQLRVDDEPLTAERVRSEIDIFLLKRGYVNPTSIVAPGPQGADCHEKGSGTIMTGQPVIIDIFPRSRDTLYNGDCTRTVVHGDVSDAVQAMHAAVVEAKAAAISATNAGVTGEQVHQAAADVINKHGYEMGLPPDDAPASYTGMVHGTGHGIGLDVHEPPLLDKGGPELVIGDVITIEPGLYSKAIGGLRIEDMVYVTQDGCENFNRLPEELDWS